MFIDVPQQTIEPPSIVRNVRVVPGKNWDLSKTAVSTPLYSAPASQYDTGTISADVPVSSEINADSPAVLMPGVIPGSVR